MSTNVSAFLPIGGEVEPLVAAFEGDPRSWLPSARREGADHWLMTVRAGAFSRNVRAFLGTTWRAGATRWRSLSWDPVPGEHEAVSLERFLPSLDGELGLHVDGGDGVTLVLDARYQPPGGPFGAAVDAVALHRVARRTIEQFLAELASGLIAAAAASDPMHETAAR